MAGPSEDEHLAPNDGQMMPLLVTMTMKEMAIDRWQVAINALIIGTCASE